MIPTGAAGGTGWATMADKASAGAGLCADTHTGDDPVPGPTSYTLVCVFCGLAASCFLWPRVFVKPFLGGSP